MNQFIIAVAQAKGGAGKSTLAAHLTVAFAKLGAKTALIDTDPQQTIISWKKARDLSNFPDKINIEIFSSTGWKINQEITKHSKHNIIVIDSPPHMETETKSVIRAADLIIVPCQPSPNDLWATDTTLEIIKKEEKPFIIVLNRCAYQSKLVKIVESHFGADIKKYFLGNRVLFASAMLYGLTSIETEPNSVASNEILQIARDVYNLRI